MLLLKLIGPTYNIHQPQRLAAMGDLLGFTEEYTNQE